MTPDEQHAFQSTINELEAQIAELADDHRVIEDRLEEMGEEEDRISVLLEQKTDRLAKAEEVIAQLSKKLQDRDKRLIQIEGGLTGIALILRGLSNG
jgi:chromosome segregation ATPase